VTFTPHPSTVELAHRLGANAHTCEVVSSVQLSPSVHEVVLRGHASDLAGAPGNDVMVRVGNDVDGFTRRRYSVRGVDCDTDQFTLWVTTAHDGAGSIWARRAMAGDHVDVIGPRGKILLDEHADWHLFMGDVSGLAAFYRMAQSIEAPGRAVFIVEIDDPDDALRAPFDEGVGVTGIFVDRRDRGHSDPAGLLSGLAAFELPPDEGHAYLFGEFAVVKVLRTALLDRGLGDEQISLKSFWRMGRRNADHGEPDKSED
jgi:NADPH-dependent ferric siderophore reductase